MSTLCLRCGDLRSPGVTEWRNGPLGLRDDDDDDNELLAFCGDERALPSALLLLRAVC